MRRLPKACRRLRRPQRRGKVTLLYASKNEQRNNATALRDYLLKTA